VQKWHKSNRNTPNAIATPPHAKLLHTTPLVAACKVLPDVAEFKTEWCSGDDELHKKQRHYKKNI
jgi:hypothetical protein